MRVLHVHTDLAGGGIEQMMVTLAVHTRAAAEVGICWCPASHPEPSEEAIHALEHAGLRLHRIPPPFLSPRYPVRLARLVKRLRPDVLHLHGGTVGCVGAIVGKACRVPAVVYTEHLPCCPQSPAQEQWCHARWIRVLRSATAPAIHSTVAVSHAVAGTLPRGSRRAEVIHNGIDLAAYDETEDHRPLPAVHQQLGIDPTTPLLVGIGALIARKAYDDAVRSLQVASELTRPLPHLVLCGEGPEKARLAELAAKLRVADRVHFLGWRNDIPGILRAATLFVHPAKDEALGLVVVEAAAAGLPIVASAVGGIPEIIHHGVNGLLVPPGDPTELAEAIQSFIDDPEMARRLGDAARQTAFERFSAEAMAEAYMELYERLLTGDDRGEDLPAGHQYQRDRLPLRGDR